ncbi:MAG: zinc-binding dehydrogenase [Rhodospirillales bacterium]|nr:zinc-binding dehydrogenase [Rhodospirillales bacterium]MDE0379230.1 zinc-binding dehydrogenase [Rhodospirillales bacterium]
MKSKSAIMTAPGAPLLIDEIDVPDPGPNQVIVKQTASGICASQIHELTKIPAESCPCVLGHEGVGVVTHVGSDVTHLKEGDWAITTWVPRDGFPGRDFIDGLAPIGTTFRGEEVGGPIGTFTEHCLASDQLAVKVAPERATPESSIVGCAVLTGAGAVLHTAKVRTEESVVVVGAGGIGLCALKMASLVQAYPVIAVDLLDEKLEFAKQWGATHTVNAAKVDAIKAVWEITGKGADYAFDAVGTVATHEQIIEMVRGGGPGADNLGGMAVMIGWPQTEFTLNGEHFVFHQRQYRGSHGSSIPDEDFPMYLRLDSEARFPLDKLVTRSYALEQINDALDDLGEGRILGRSIIRF